MDTQSFELGEEFSADSCFVRQESVFRGFVTVAGSSDFPAAAGRYHLSACLCCPWSQRAVIGRLLKGLEDAISLSYVDPYCDTRGWAFSGGDFVDQANGFSFLSEAYLATDPGFDDGLTIPVLWDSETKHPSRIIPSGPVLDSLAPHNRG